MRSDKKRVAWWADHGDEGFSGCGWLIDCRDKLWKNGDSELLEQYDRLVQGVGISVLIAEVQAELDKANLEHEKNKGLASGNGAIHCDHPIMVAIKEGKVGGPYLKRDRYGEYYPDYEGMRWARQHRQRLERRLKSMKNGDWGPSHSIEIDSEGDVIEGTIEAFVEKEQRGPLGQAYLEQDE